MKTVATLITVMLLVSTTSNADAQQINSNRISIDDAIGLAKNNLQYKVNTQQINKGKAQAGTATVFPKTGIFAENEDYRPSDSKGILKIGLSQSMAWPGLYKSQKKMYNEQLKYYQANTAAIDANIKRDIRNVYYQIWYLQNKKQLYNKLDSIYTSLSNAARIKVKTGDSPGLDSISANVRMRELQALSQQVNRDINIQQQSLMQLLNTTDTILPKEMPLEKLQMPVTFDTAHPLLLLQSQNIKIANAGVSVAKNENKPEFSGRFFTQRLYGMSDPFSGFSVSAALPLFGVKAYKNKIRVAQAEFLMQQIKYDFDKQQFTTQQMQALQEVEKNNSLLSFYQSTGIKQADEIIKASSLAYRAGEIGFAELSQFLAQAIEIQKNYLEVLNIYNQSVIQYYYFVNQ